MVGNSDTLFFLIIAVFQSICLIYIFRKYSSNYWVSIFLFIVSTNYISWMFNGMRQFIAVCLCFACTSLMLKKKYMPMILLILLASTIHGTAIIMIPLVFIAQGKAWNKKTIFLIAMTLLAIVFVERFTSLLDILTDGTQYEGFLDSEVMVNDNGTNPIRVLVFSVPAIISFMYRKNIQNANESVINFCTNMSIIATAIYAVSMVTSGILIGRLPIYTLMYSYILLPWEIDNLFNKESRRLIYMSMIVLYIGFFYYQMHFAYSLI
ncbi:EpsG family protein [Terrisporobacter sp.]|uniref:EpsG family protein n=1 Tax=Terrisporobacter sp. TaxID=1965305 RepID=UPI002897149E|nr:EpsG family protein [Terrisporobacter sp.]